MYISKEGTALVSKPVFAKRKSKSWGTHVSIIASIFHGCYQHTGLERVTAKTDWLFLVQIQVVPIHNNGDPKRPKEIWKTLWEHAHAHRQLPPSHWPWAWCSKESKERKKGYRKDHRFSKRSLWKLTYITSGNKLPSKYDK